MSITRVRGVVDAPPHTPPIMTNPSRTPLMLKYAVTIYKGCGVLSMGLGGCADEDLPRVWGRVE
jgi:hypothetical protein